MITNTDTGNSNVFKIFMGRYPTTENRYVMLTILNDVQFMDDYTADETGKLTTLPEQCRPSTVLTILAPIQRTTQTISVVTDGTMKAANTVQKQTISVRTDESNLPYGPVIINPDGTVMGEAGSTYHMNGVSFNISANFYR